jgi:hypothetical protein
LEKISTFIVTALVIPKEGYGQCLANLLKDPRCLLKKLIISVLGSIYPNFSLLQSNNFQAAKISGYFIFTSAISTPLGHNNGSKFETPGGQL